MSKGIGRGVALFSAKSKHISGRCSQNTLPVSKCDLGAAKIDDPDDCANERKDESMRFSGLIHP